MLDFEFWMGGIRLRASRLPPSFAYGVASWRDKGGGAEGFFYRRISITH